MNDLQKALLPRDPSCPKSNRLTWGGVKLGSKQQVVQGASTNVASSYDEKSKEKSLVLRTKPEIVEALPVSPRSSSGPLTTLSPVLSPAPLGLTDDVTSRP
jgi:hypothetical protein